MSGRNILVVGGGSIGERHVRCFQCTGRTEVALCEANEPRGRRVALKYRIPLESSYEKALESRPHAVVICTPAHLHVRMALRAIEAGCHVLIEKPLGVDTEGVKDLGEAAQSAGRVVSVAYVWRMHPALRRAKAIVQSEELGAVLQIAANCGQDFAALRPGYEYTYYAQRDQGGGAIQDGLTHFANSVEMLVGPTTSVMCEAAHLVIPNVSVEDSVGVVARNGRVLSVYSFSQGQKPNESFIHIHCERGSLRIDLTGKRLGIFRDGAWLDEETPYPEHDVLFAAQAGAFLDTVEGTAEPSCSLAEAASTLRFNLACFESFENGRRVVL